SRVGRLEDRAGRDIPDAARRRQRRPARGQGGRRDRPRLHAYGAHARRSRPHTADRRRQRRPRRRAGKVTPRPILLGEPQGRGRASAGELGRVHGDGARSQGEGVSPYQIPSSAFASSLAIVRGSQGGCQTNSTFTFSTPGRRPTTYWTWSIRTGPSGQAGVVSVIWTLTSPSSVLVMPYRRPRSTMFIPISGSYTARSASAISSGVAPSPTAGPNVMCSCRASDISDPHLNLAILDADLEGLQRVDGRQRQHLAGAHVEARAVQGALHDVAEQLAIREVCLVVGANVRGRVELTADVVDGDLLLADPHLADLAGRDVARVGNRHEISQGTTGRSGAPPRPRVGS